MNNDNKIFRYDKTRDASRVDERNENSERMLRKTNHEIKKMTKKLKKIIEKTKNTIERNI